MTKRHISVLIYTIKIKKNMKKLLLMLLILGAPLTKIISAPMPVFIHHSSEQTDYITITPKGDTIYVYDKEIVSKEIYEKKVKEEKILWDKVVSWFILLVIALILNSILIPIASNYGLNDDVGLFFLLILPTIFSIFYLVVWPILCAFTSWEFGIIF